MQLASRRCDEIPCIVEAGWEDARKEEKGNRKQELHTNAVIPAQAGIHVWLRNMDPRLRGDDGYARAGLTALLARG
jgi:hypothetical protein